LAPGRAGRDFDPKCAPNVVKDVGIHYGQLPTRTGANPPVARNPMIRNNLGEGDRHRRRTS
jgi:hypothetical protein